MMQPLISIITPVYNTAQYLPACLSSILNQTYENIEILIIDDASTDNSTDVIKTFTDPRIKFFQQSTNQGQSVARNLGLDEAKGEYICFVDSDDIAHPQMVELLYKAIVETGADFSYAEHERIVSLDNLPCETYKNLTFEEILEPSFNHLTKKRKLPMEIWAKIYTRQSIGSTRFYPRIYHEDNLFSIIYFDSQSKGVYVPAALYYYLQRDGSVMNTAYSMLKAHSKIVVIRELYQYFKNAPAKLALVRRRFLNRIAKDSLKFATSSTGANKEIADYVRRELQRLRSENIITYEGLPLFWRIKLWWYIS